MGNNSGGIYYYSPLQPRGFFAPTHTHQLLFRVVLDGAVVYIRRDSFSPHLPKAKYWLFNSFSSGRRDIYFENATDLKFRALLRILKCLIYRIFLGTKLLFWSINLLLMAFQKGIERRQCFLKTMAYGLFHNFTSYTKYFMIHSSLVFSCCSSTIHHFLVCSIWPGAPRSTISCTYLLIWKYFSWIQRNSFFNSIDIK